MKPGAQFTFHPATPERWKDVTVLFGERGACSGCWCMYWRESSSEFKVNKGEKNRRALKKLVAEGRVPGLLAYADGTPIGWISVAPRQEFVRLQAHRTLKPADEQPVWSVVCFFVAKPWRRQGVSVALLHAAAEYARKHGATIIEGYPTEPGQMLPDPFIYTGIVSAFRQARFVEVARPARTRAIMRRDL